MPWACRSEWHSAFQLPLYLWKEGFTEDSIKLHCIMTQSICTPLPAQAQVQLGQDEDEEEPDGHKGSVTRLVKARLRRCFAGDWKDL